MKKLPEVNESFEELYGMLIAPIKSKLLLTGIELGVFNLLSEPRSANAVAEALGTHSENTRLFLDGLAASNLLEKNDGLYQNTAVTQAFLAEGSPTFLGKVLTWTAQMCYIGSENLSKMVKDGPLPPPSKASISSEDMWVHQAVLMADNQRAGWVQQGVDIVSQLPEFPSFKKMLDLGGGPGLHGIAIVASHPSMKGVIFDKPAMVKVAETFIKEYEIEDRMEVMGGDYTCDSIGGEYDLIWAKAALNFADNIDLVMKKIYGALNPGGVFISYAEGLTHERTKPETHVLGMMSMALMGQDMCFDQGFITDSMLRVGFKSVRSRTLDTDWGPMELDTGRKGKMLNSNKIEEKEEQK
ncbi:methyltransferase [ANME-1 cluster archaeon AG-394-G21]|nr:methyltransferase [ANME-1 cluster archaeon AG-394-G21]